MMLKLLDVVVEKFADWEAPTKQSIWGRAKVVSKYLQGAPRREISGRRANICSDRPFWHITCLPDYPFSACRLLTLRTPWLTSRDHHSLPSTYRRTIVSDTMIMASPPVTNNRRLTGSGRDPPNGGQHRWLSVAHHCCQEALWTGLYLAQQGRWESL